MERKSRKTHGLQGGRSRVYVYVRRRGGEGIAGGGEKKLRACACVRRYHGSGAGVQQQPLRIYARLDHRQPCSARLASPRTLLPLLYTLESRASPESLLLFVLQRTFALSWPSPTPSVPSPAPPRTRVFGLSLFLSSVTARERDHRRCRCRRGIYFIFFYISTFPSSTILLLLLLATAAVVVVVIFFSPYPIALSLSINSLRQRSRSLARVPPRAAPFPLASPKSLFYARVFITLYVVTFSRGCVGAMGMGRVRARPLVYI